MGKKKISGHSIEELRLVGGTVLNVGNTAVLQKDDGWDELK